MALAIPVYGAAVEWSDDGTTWVRIAKAKNVVIPSVTTDYRDVTSLDSVNGFRDWAKGLKDGGELTLSTIYSKDGYAAAAAKGALTSPVHFRVTLPLDDDQATGDAFTFKGHVTPTIPEGDIEGDMMLDIAIRTTGEVVWTEGTAA